MELMSLASAVKELRERTGMGYGMCASAWKESQGNLDTAIVLLKAKGATRADKLHDRSTNAGFTGMYRHHDGRIVTVVQLHCETDFVSNTAEFRNLADDLAMQAAQGVLPLGEFLDQEMFTRSGVTVQEAVNELSARTGEHIAVGLVQRHTL